MRIYILIILIFSSLYSNAGLITLQELSLIVSQSNKINILIDPKIDIKRNFYFYDDFNKNLTKQSFQFIIENNGLILKYLGDVYYITEDKNDTQYDHIKYRNITTDDVKKISEFYKLDITFLGDSEIIVKYKDENKFLSFKKYLSKISSPKHVYLEGEIIAVNETKLNDIGIDFASISSKVFQVGSFDLGLITNVNNNDFIQQIIATRSTISNPLQLGDISSFISFLKDTGTSTVVTRPNMLIMDGKESVFKAGKQIRIVDSSTESIRDSGEYSSKQYQMLDVGLTLKCKAQIVEDKASLQFQFVVSDLAEYKPSLDELIIDNKTYTSTFNIVDGEEIVLAGLTSEMDIKSKSGLPFFSDIPLLGRLFEHESNTKQKISYIIYFKGTIK